MSARSLNKVTLIGNLTRDPELRYTPAGTAVCTFGLATNRSWTTQTGETKEETEFHRIVAWNKLGELCSQLLAKGRKVYVEGRLSTHSWTGQDGTQRTSTEVVIEDMIVLDSKRPPVASEGSAAVTSAPVSVSVKEESNATPEPVSAVAAAATAVVTGPPVKIKTVKKNQEQDKEIKEVKEEKKKDVKEEEKAKVSEDITPDDIPF